MPKCMVYFAQIRDGNWDAPVKIGRTGDFGSLWVRIKTYRDNNPYDVRLIGLITEATYKTERLIHHMFREYRIRGEWFHMSDDLAQFIARHTDEVPEPPWGSERMEAVAATLKEKTPLEAMAMVESFVAQLAKNRDNRGVTRERRKLFIGNDMQDDL